MLALPGHGKFHDELLPSAHHDGYSRVPILRPSAVERKAFSTASDSASLGSPNKSKPLKSNTSKDSVLQSSKNVETVLSNKSSSLSKSALKQFGKYSPRLPMQTSNGSPVAPKDNRRKTLNMVKGSTPVGSFGTGRKSSVSASSASTVTFDSRKKKTSNFRSAVPTHSAPDTSEPSVTIGQKDGTLVATESTSYSRRNTAQIVDAGPEVNSADELGTNCETDVVISDDITKLNAFAESHRNYNV